MATAVSKAQLDGWYQEVYGEAEDAVPENAEIQTSVPFESRTKIGDSYHFPVILSRSQGITIANTNDAFALNEAESLVSKDASVTSAQVVVREKIGYSTVTAASGGKAAFGDAMDPIVNSLKQTSHMLVEMFLLYGGSTGGIGLIQGRVSGGGTGTQVFQITKASWSPGIWMQLQNTYIQVFAAGFGTLRNAATMQVTVIDPDERTITCVGTSGQMDTIIATDVIMLRGAYSGAGGSPVWPYGIDGICQNTGTLFGIAANTYALWKASTYGAGSAALTMAKIQAALLKGVTRGGLAEDVTARVSVYSWTDVMTDLSALRRFADESKREMVMGTKEIAFYGVNGKKLTLKPHSCVKASEAFVGPDRTLKRIGSTDVTLKLGVNGEGEGFFRQLESNAGFELRTFSDQAAIITRPALWTKITGIINNSLPNASTET